MNLTLATCARHPSESVRPDLWPHHAWAPALGVQGTRLYDLAGPGYAPYTTVATHWNSDGVVYTNDANRHTLGNLGGFGSKVSQELTAVMNLRTTGNGTNRQGVFGVFQNHPNSCLFITVDNNPDTNTYSKGRIRAYIGTGLNDTAIEGGATIDTGISDGNLKTLVVNFKPLADTLEIWLNGVSLPIFYKHQSFSLYGNFDLPLMLGGLNINGTFSLPFGGHYRSPWAYHHPAE